MNFEKFIRTPFYRTPLGDCFSESSVFLFDLDLSSHQYLTHIIKSPVIWNPMLTVSSSEVIAYVSAYNIKLYKLMSTRISSSAFVGDKEHVLLEAVVRRCYIKKGVLENFVKFTGKHLCQGLFFNKISGASNIAKFLRTPFLIEHLWLLLLCCTKKHLDSLKKYQLRTIP